MGQGVNCRPIGKEARTLTNRCFLNGEGEEMIGHILLHCSKVRPSGCYWTCS